ncbi:MAG TPA: glycosyltransferase family 4 protein [Gemmataceae bacterium]|nr:glycosyltransferase family 4 protein [Gemmataceae bacterium]
MKILFAQKQILFPHDTGAKIRVLNILRHLARRHEITFLSGLRPGEEIHVEKMHALGLRLETVRARESPRASLRFYRDAALNLFSPYPFSISRNFDPALRARGRALVAQEAYDLLICDTVFMARNTRELDVPARILFQHNVESLIFQRHADVATGWLRSRYMALQWRRMRRFESDCGRFFHTIIAVSEQDRQTFAREYIWHHVQTIDTAVDVDYFRPNGTPEHPDHIVFVGSLDWMPNQDGVIHFVQEVWPRIRHARPQAIFRIVGRNPARSVRRLERVDGVEVVGTVPDVRPHLAEAAVVVVPLLVGGGTRIKIFEALAMGKALVSTRIGAEGLPVQSGEHLLLADSPADFAEAVIQLLKDPERRGRLGQAASRLVTAHYGSEVVARQFEQICEQTVGANRAAGTSPAARQRVRGRGVRL